MAIVPSLNALKHAKLMLRAAAADYELQGHVAATINQRQQFAEGAMASANDFNQVAQMLDEMIVEREKPKEETP
jgi:hypothetical protein